MCCYKTLHHNEHGYVVKCNKCAHLHVAFGNTILAFSRDEFAGFLKNVRDAHDDHKYHQCQKAKMIQIPTALRSIVLIYNLKEIIHLSTLLNEAKKMLDKEILISFSEN